MKEEDNVMVAGGKVRVNGKEGNSLTVQFWNIFNNAQFYFDSSR